MQSDIIWTTGPQTAQGQSSQFLDSDEVAGETPTELASMEVKNVITILSYFNRLAYCTVHSPEYLSTDNTIRAPRGTPSIFHYFC